MAWSIKYGERPIFWPKLKGIQFNVLFDKDKQQILPFDKLKAGTGLLFLSTIFTWEMTETVNYKLQ